MKREKVVDILGFFKDLIRENPNSEDTEYYSIESEIDNSIILKECKEAQKNVEQLERNFENSTKPEKHKSKEKSGDNQTTIAFSKNIHRDEHEEHEQEHGGNER